MALLDVAGVTVAFDDRLVLDDVSLTVASGDIVALHGPSGHGKTTLLNVIAGLIKPDAGTVSIDGVDVTATPTHRRHVGMVFQGGQLFAHRSVLDNVAFGLQMAGINTKERHARSEAWLDRVGLSGFGPRSVTDLSGGEARRVALARTLIVEPAIVLLDEPLTGLDRELHDRLAADLRSLLIEAGTTAVLVTHDRDEGTAIADRCLEIAALSARLPSMKPPTMDEMRVVEISATDTHELRRRVLRNGNPESVVVFDGDDDPTTVHLGLMAGGRIIAISTWLARPMPGDDTDVQSRVQTREVQLRGMATDAAFQGTGAGSLMLAGGIARAAESGADRVWARARSSAMNFYVKNGFEVLGDVFIDPPTGLPHQIVRRFIP
jgi:thiamine transport system ATP-binding protein